MLISYLNHIFQENWSSTLKLLKVFRGLPRFKDHIDNLKEKSTKYVGIFTTYDTNSHQNVVTFITVPKYAEMLRNQIQTPYKLFKT